MKRHFEKLLTLPRPLAIWVIRTAPERFAGIDTFLSQAFYHRFAAVRTERRVFGCGLFSTMLKPFGGKSFGETAFFGKGL